MARGRKPVDLSSGKKRCPHCGVKKSIDEFWKNRKNGRPISWCKKCMQQNVRKWEALNPERRRATMSRTSRKWYLDRKWGLTPAQYDEMFEKQDGGCAICGAETSVNGWRLAIDHDAKTGKIRGLLCTRCNRGIGAFEHDAVLLRAAIKYLGKTKVKV